MLSVYSHRYDSPKWQAYITPEDKAYVFDDGYEISSLFELKQALVNLPEDLLNKHINPENHLANWVETVIGDKDLAEAMRKYDHRWGMVVAVERQMMRTLNLPDYLAQRWLGKAAYSFTFVSGEVINSVEELADTLASINDDAVAFHQERTPNDISKWVNDVIGDYLLAELLEEAGSRDEMHRFVEDHLAMLKEAAE